MNAQPNHQRPGHQHPTKAQIAAADPKVSAWVGANAGSGKTRVLAQRVARLLLEDAKPERILCLTYTKAAAAEMQNRFFEMLGGWAMAPDDWLGAELAAIAGAETPVADGERLAEARRLFARALETPGGLKIQTIHAFCDSLLRRFPLEAGVSPRFEVLDERQAALMIAAIRAGMAAEAEAGANASFDAAAERLNEGQIDVLVDAVLAGRAESPEDKDGAGIDARLAAHFGSAAREDANTLARQALDRLDWGRLEQLATCLADGGVADTAVSEVIWSVRDEVRTDPLSAAQALARAYATVKGDRRARKGFPVKAVIDAWPSADAMTDEMLDWAGDYLEAIRAREAAARARDLDTFASALLAHYRRAKETRALLDFDDLVARARALLTDSDMAAWALYRLDQGIDHILVDEAQDTAPGQWDVIRAIAHEFHSGASARDANRTLFVVGDEKQSIYSFQGAEPQAFGENRAYFGDWLAGMGSALARPDLITSFRSAPGILAYVDAVFAGDAAAGLTVSGEAVEHKPYRERDASRVDIWPLTKPADKEDPKPWWQPVDAVPPGSAKARLARILAEEIRRMVAEERLPAREGRPGRRVRPGDILVLVQRRDALAQGLIRELKNHGLPVAGSDRLSLAAELAVKDLLALAKVAITPGDDLSLAALLRSPLFGISEEELFALAHGRESTLWRAVMGAEARHPEAVAVLRDMAAKADFIRPYEFLERVLVHHDGRRRLLARLGHEAEDPIDELLAQALGYEARAAPSLAGFVAWIEAGDIKVRREMEHGADEIRVMTVHGAKGLEAPVVILPDTMARPGGAGRQTLLPARRDGNAPRLMLWAGAKAQDDPVTAAARAEAEAREAAERKRLLYVALTRAEDWLILCGAEPGNTVEGAWYDLLAAGMNRLGGAAELPGPQGLDSPALRREDNPVPVTCAPPDGASSAAAARPHPPAWLTLAQHEERVKRLSPSTLGEEPEAGEAGGGALERELAMARGSAVHRLLERLPEYPQADQKELAKRLIEHEFPELPCEIAAAAITEVRAVFDAPFAARIFGSGSLAEPGMAIYLPAVSPLPMLGRIDRLVIGADRVLVVDFKTDTEPTASADDVPEKYLVQLGCYRAALAALYPERIVEAAILWTGGPQLMPLDGSALDRALADWVARAP